MRRSFAASVAGGVVLLFSSGAAHAANEDYVKTVAPLIGDGCRNGRIDAWRLRRAMLASDKLQPALSVKAPEAAQSGADSRPPSLGAELAASVVRGGSNANAANLRQLLREWISHQGAEGLPYEAGGVRIWGPGRVRLNEDQTEAVLAAILDGRDSYIFECRSDGPRSPPQRDERRAGDDDHPSSATRFSVAKTAGDLAVGEVKEKSAAELSFVDDDVADTNSYSVRGAVGLVFNEFPYSFVDDPERRVGGHAQGAVFVQFERDGSDATADADEVNNLSLGGMLGGYIAFQKIRGSHYFAFTGRVTSDDRLDSRAYKLAASLTPELAGNGRERVLAPRIGFDWDLTLHAEGLAVDDPGRKALLQDSPEWFRLGYDARADVVAYVLPAPWEASLSAEYKLREGLTEDGGDAQWFTSAVLFRPNDNLGFGLSYDRGEVLDSLEFVDRWTLKVTFRR